MQNKWHKDARYWGKLYTQDLPISVWSFVCLGLIGFVIVKTPLRWALLAATILGILCHGENIFQASIHFFSNTSFI